jgi:hypothetical protein
MLEFERAPLSREDVAARVFAQQCDGTDGLVWCSPRLFVRIRGRAASWQYRYTHDGRERWHKLGDYSDQKSANGAITYAIALETVWRLDMLRKRCPDLDHLRSLVMRRLADATSDAERTEIRTIARPLFAAREDENERRSRLNLEAAEDLFRVEGDWDAGAYGSDKDEAFADGYEITTLVSDGLTHTFKRFDDASEE